MAQAFDTSAAVRDLEAAGMERAQAEVIASAIRGSQGDLVTRADLRAEIANLERRSMGYALALAGVLFAAIKFL